MFRRHRLCLALVLAIACPLIAAAQQLSDSGIEQRVNTLLQKMTLEEKAGQLTQMPGNSPQMPEMVKQGKIGSLLGVLGAKDNNAAQRVAVEQSRLERHKILRIYPYGCRRPTRSTSSTSFTASAPYFPCRLRALAASIRN